MSVILILVAAVLVVALATRTDQDTARVLGELDANLNPLDLNFDNEAGVFGAYLSCYLDFLFGWLAFFIPAVLLARAARLLFADLPVRLAGNLALIFLFSLFGTMLLNIHLCVPIEPSLETTSYGGSFIGKHLTIIVTKLLGETGSYLLLSGLILLLLVLYTSFVLVIKEQLTEKRVAKMKTGAAAIAGEMKPLFNFGWLKKLFLYTKATKTAEPEDSFADTLEEEIDNVSQADIFDGTDYATDETEKETPKKQRQAKKRTVMIRSGEQANASTVEYTFPGLDLLTENQQTGQTVTQEELTANAKMLKDTLETFGVAVEGNISSFPGPVITRFEFKPGAGVKVNQVLNLSDDLALALKAKRIRILAPIPGKAAVGVEIPNRAANTVFLKDVLQTDQFNSPALKLPLALGMTTSGAPFITDLTKAPHLLIAGATGSGKSVCMNVLISSLIYRLHPQQVRFIFVDPKMLELSIYAGIPHLARPVITDPKRAEKVLNDMVNEMENRYRRLAAVSVRNIEDFNRKQTEESEKLPYIVIFVDELADLMMSSQSAKTELLITRLAQMSRAVGIHLILATQRPSVDVITGLIKANFPARIAFQVSSKVDSRTILDANGAEKLLGNGDMLFMSAGQAEATRIHGAYLSSEETERVVGFIKEQGVTAPTTDSANVAGGDEDAAESIDFGDPLFREACEVVIRHKQGSVSLLQRRLGIGYQRAARLIDKLEEAAIVSPFDGSKAREVIVDKAYIDALFAGRKSSAPAFSDKN